MSVNDPKIVLVCGMSGVGKSTFINVVTGANLPVGHGDNSETSEISIQGIPLINLNGVYVQLVDVPGFDDTRDESDAEMYLQLTAWLSTRYPGNKRVSSVVYVRPISKTRVDKLEASFIGMFKALVGEEHLHHVLLLTNRWNSPPDEGNEALERKLASDEKYLGTKTGKRVRTSRLLDKYTKEEAHHALMAIHDLPHFTFQVQRETIEGQLSAQEATAGKRLNDYMQGRVPELIKTTEKALQDTREAKKRLEEEERKTQQALDEKARAEDHLCSMHLYCFCLSKRHPILLDSLGEGSRLGIAWIESPFLAKVGGAEGIFGGSIPVFCLLGP